MGGTSDEDVDDVVGFGARTEEWVLVLTTAAAAAADVDVPEVTTEVHPRCVDTFEDDLVVAGGPAVVGRQDGEKDEED